MHARRGLTLLELLLVTVVISLVVGTGLGMLASLDYESREAPGAIRSTLREARESALVRRAPAVVRFDAESGAFRAETLLVVGTWHFEDEGLTGSTGLEGRRAGVELTEEGYLGRALDFRSAPREAHASLALGGDPAFDVHAGFALEFAVRLDAYAEARLVNLRRVCGVDLSRGNLRGWFMQEAEDELGRFHPAGHVLVSAAQGVLPLKDWHVVRLEYDQSALSLYVDGALVASRPATAAVWGGEDTRALGIELSEARSAFPGAIDQLVVSTRILGEEGVLPEGVRFGPEFPPVVVFDVDGSLDRRFHGGGLDLRLFFDDGRERRLFVSLMGTVQ